MENTIAAILKEYHNDATVQRHVDAWRFGHYSSSEEMLRGLCKELAAEKQELIAKLTKVAQTETND